jgi:hypothetical protein
VSCATSEQTVAKVLIDEAIVQDLAIDDIAARQTAKGTARILPYSTFPIP